MLVPQHGHDPGPSTYKASHKMARSILNLMIDGSAVQTQLAFAFEPWQAQFVSYEPANQRIQSSAFSPQSHDSFFAKEGPDPAYQMLNRQGDLGTIQATAGKRRAAE